MFGTQSTGSSLSYRWSPLVVIVTGASNRCSTLAIHAPPKLRPPQQGDQANRSASPNED
jgi:hypothetical protein